MVAPMFVKIGANDGVTGDPCSDLLIGCPSWRGVLIEPVPYCCDRLRQNFSDTRRFRVVEAAIASDEGTHDLYFVQKDARTALPDLPVWYDQLGTFDPKHIEKHFGARIKPFIEKRPVPVRTYSAVMADNDLGDYALLHVDTEGYDFEILKMALACAPLPAMIFIEHAHLSREDRRQMRVALRSHGYSVRNCGMDYFAIRRGWRP
jgi:FkbM family methyltransferase